MHCRDSQSQLWAPNKAKIPEFYQVFLCSWQGSDEAGEPHILSERWSGRAQWEHIPLAPRETLQLINEFLPP